MFSLFAKKAAMADDMGSNGEEMASAVPTTVKIGGHEFSDPQAFDSWLAKAKANNELIQAGPDGAHYPINSNAAKAEIIKADLQLHGVDPVAAQKAVDQIPGLKVPAPKPVLIYKAKAASADSGEPTGEAVVQKGAAKAGKAKAFRTPKGPVQA